MPSSTSKYMNLSTLYISNRNYDKAFKDGNYQNYPDIVSNLDSSLSTLFWVGADIELHFNSKESIKLKHEHNMQWALPL